MTGEEKNVEKLEPSEGSHSGAAAVEGRMVAQQPHFCVFIPRTRERV